MEQETERAPLLTYTGGAKPSDSTKARRITAAIFCLELLTVLAYDVLDLPLVRFLERAVCSRYYSVSSTPRISKIEWDESQCKIPSVQNELAYLLGVRVAVNAVPCLLMSIPWARFSDRRGRKLAIGLGCTGELLALIWVIVIGAFPQTFNVRLVWLSAVFLFIGGGVRYLLCLYFTVIADIMPPAKRTRYMFLLYSLIHLSGLLAPPIGALLMTYSQKIPFAVALSCMIIRYGVLFSMPETKPSTHLSEGLARQEQSDLSAEPTFDPGTGVKHDYQVQHTNIFTTVLSLLAIPGIWFCFLSFLLKRIAFSSENLIYQYTSEVLRQRLDQVVWIRVALGLGASLMTVIVLPLLSRTLSGKGVAAQFVNVWVIRFSLLIVIIGFVIMWLAKHPVQIGTALLLCGIGEGLEPSLEALASSLVKQASNADLFAIFSVIDTIAKIIGGPLMAAMLSIRNSDGVTMGACFLLSACLFTALWILSWTLWWQKLEEISRHVDEDGE